MAKKGLEYAQKVICANRDMFCGIGIGYAIGTLFVLVVCVAIFA